MATCVSLAAQTDGSTCTHLACQEGHAHLVPLLAAAGATLSGRQADGACPLHLACQRGFTQVVHALLCAGADTNAVMPGGTSSVQSTTGSPLAIASALGHADIVACLLSRGADVNGRMVRVDPGVGVWGNGCGGVDGDY